MRIYKTLTDNIGTQTKQMSDLVGDREIMFNYCKYVVLSLTLTFHKYPEVYNPWVWDTAAGQGDWTEQRLGITAEWIHLGQSQGLNQRNLSCRFSISSYRAGPLKLLCIYKEKHLCMWLVLSFYRTHHNTWDFLHKISVLHLHTDPHHVHHHCEMQIPWLCLRSNLKWQFWSLREKSTLSIPSPSWFSAVISRMSFTSSVNAHCFGETRKQHILRTPLHETRDA